MYMIMFTADLLVLSVFFDSQCHVTFACEYLLVSVAMYVSDCLKAYITANYRWLLTALMHVFYMHGLLANNLWLLIPCSSTYFY